MDVYGAAWHVAFFVEGRLVSRNDDDTGRRGETEVNPPILRVDRTNAVDFEAVEVDARGEGADGDTPEAGCVP